MVFEIVEWFRHFLIMFVFLFSSPWRWTHKWPKHVGEPLCNKPASIKLKCIFWSLHIFHNQNSWFETIHIVYNPDQQVHNICIYCAFIGLDNKLYKMHGTYFKINHIELRPAIAKSPCLVVKTDIYNSQCQTQPLSVHKRKLVLE